MAKLPPEIDPFISAWRKLPRTGHPVLPQKKDINPIQFGEFLHLVCVTELIGPHEMIIKFVGSEFERLSGISVGLQNYYDMLPQEFVGATQRFHRLIMGTPCGAFVSDMITARSGSRYFHETVHLPLVDETGKVKYLMVYGVGNKPVGDHAERHAGNHNANNIKELFYFDIGAGAPTDHVSNFKFHRISA